VSVSESEARTKRASRSSSGHGDGRIIVATPC
jgi:hypothetical protein